MTLRELRLWHWRRVMRHRENQRLHTEAAEAFEAKHGKRASYSRRMARAAETTANFHLGAVQALNDCFPDAFDTAERDAILADRIKEMKL